MDRDVAMGIGPEAFADAHDVALSRIQGGARRLIEHQIKILQGRNRDAAKEASSKAISDSSKRSPPPVDSDVGKSREAEQQAQSCEHQASKGTPLATSTTILNTPRASTTLTNNSEAVSRQASTSATADAEDSDDLIVVEARSVTPAVKRKASVGPKMDPTKKRLKRTESSGDESEVETPTVKRPAVASTSSGSKTVKPSPRRQKQAEESADETEGSDDDEASDSESDEEEDEDPRAMQETYNKANNEFNRSCRTCKANANRALRTKYETVIRDLKRQSKSQLNNAKETAQKALKAAKTKAVKDRDEQKAKYEKDMNALREAYDHKMATLNKKHDSLRGSFRAMKAALEDKNKTLTKERDATEAKRKAVEKSAGEEIRDMKNDMKADEALLKEQRKQMRKERDAEVNQLKPAHSALVKAKEKEIKDLTAEATSLRQDLSETNVQLRNARIDAAADRHRVSIAKVGEEKAQSHARAVDENLREFERYLTAVEQRRDVDLARLEEKLEHERAISRVQKGRFAEDQRHCLAGLQEKLDHERANSQEQKGRFVEEHRINLHLQATLQQEVQKRKANDARVQALEAELSKVKADAGRA